MTAAAFLCCAAPVYSAGSQSDLVREALLQQSAAQHAGCTGVQRTLKAGTDAALVVQTAVEIGFNACQVIRCALEGTAEPDNAFLCDMVIRGAALAGVLPDVISRCSTEFCDPTAVAAILEDAFLETTYCYFTFQPPGPPEALPPQPLINRDAPPSQASPFRF